MKQEKIGQKLSPILEEIEDSLWDFEYYREGEKPEFTEEGFRGATKIFMSALLDKMWDFQESINMPQKEREKKAEFFGKEVREIILLSTGIDMHKLYQNKNGKTKTRTKESSL